MNLKHERSDIDRLLKVTQSVNIKITFCHLPIASTNKNHFSKIKSWTLPPCINIGLAYCNRTVKGLKLPPPFYPAISLIALDETGLLLPGHQHQV